MSSRAVLALLTALLAVVATACGTSVAAAPAAAPTTTAPAAPGTVRLEGAVTAPRTLDPAALAAMPQTAVDVTFGSAKGTEHHHEQGVLLATLLPVSALALTPGRKNDQAALAVTATGADGYAATVSYGEIAPDLGNRGILISTAEDGKPLPQPRLVVPGDVKGARYVSELVDLRVGRVS
jgi:ABC-type transport system substrate-binding protein